MFRPTSNPLLPRQPDPRSASDAAEQDWPPPHAVAWPCRSGRAGAKPSPLVATLAAVLMSGLPLGAAERSAGVRLRHQVSPGGLTIYDVRVQITSRPVGRPEAIAGQETLFGRLTRALLKDRRAGMAMGIQMLELLDQPLTDGRPATRPSSLLPPPSGKTGPSGVQLPPSSSLSESQPSSASSPAASRPAASQPVSPLAPSSARVLLSTMAVTPRYAQYLLPARTTPMKKLMWPLVEVAIWPDDAVTAGQTWVHNVPWVAAGCKQRVQVGKIESVKGDTHVTLWVTTATEAKNAGASDAPFSAQTRLVWSTRDQELLSLVGEGVSREPSSEGGRLVTIRISYERIARRQMAPVRQTLERQAVLHLAQAIMAYQRGDAEGASTAARACVRRWPTSYWRPLADDLIRRLDAEQQARKPLTLDELRLTLGQLLSLLNQAEVDSDESLAAWCGVSFQRYTQINGPELRKFLADSDPQLRALACLAFAFGKVPAEVGLIERHSDDADVQVRRLCLRALALRGSPVTDVQRLLAGAKDEDAGVRRWACEALGACTTKVSEHRGVVRAALVDRLADASPSVLLAAAEALLRIGVPDDAEKVKQLAAKDSRAEVRFALAEILQAAEDKVENDEALDPKSEIGVTR